MSRSYRQPAHTAGAGLEPHYTPIAFLATTSRKNAALSLGIARLRLEVHVVHAEALSKPKIHSKLSIRLHRK